MEFEERTIKVMIDDDQCPSCETHACIAACRTYARGMLVLKDGKPVLAGDMAFAKRVGTECLACEYACRVRGKGALRIEAPIPGLDAYRKKYGLA